MNPYEEIQRLREENAMLRARLEAFGQRFEERNEERFEPIRSIRIPKFPDGEYHMNECYEVFRNIMENYGFEITGIGNGYKFQCDDGTACYFMPGKMNFNVWYLMIQIEDGLIYMATKMRVSERAIEIEYKKGKKSISIEIEDDNIILNCKDVISIKRVNREISIKKDDSKPTSWANLGNDDSFYNYSLNGTDDIIDIRQHPKSWRDDDGNLITEYFK